MSFPTRVVVEGETKLIIPDFEAFKGPSGEYTPSLAPVFYNPRMEICRDLGVSILQVYQRLGGLEINVCEPLTGCGARGVRYAYEVRGVKHVVVNDLNPRAFELAKRNVEANNLGLLVDVKNVDANLLLQTYLALGERFDVIDIDPFGSPVPFIEASLKALKDRGLLCLTATDLAPLCGVYPSACLRRYGGIPLRVDCCHELAARLLLGALCRKAAEHDIGFNPLLVYYFEHYVRAYVTVSLGASKANECVKELGYVAHCKPCLSREVFKGLARPLPSLCQECGSKIEVGGPVWCGPLFNRRFCKEVLEEVKGRRIRFRRRILKLLEVLMEEPEEPPLYYVIDVFCDKLNTPTPSTTSVIKELRGRGFKASKTIFNMRGVKTDAKARELKDVLTSLSFPKPGCH